jgi:polygalacturonase
MTDKTARRDFLKIAGAGFAGASLNTAPVLSQSQASEKSSANLPGRGVLDVRSFGATGGGTVLDSPAINKDIETANVSGGGTLYFPAGSYLCYSIRLKSNVSLYLDQGANHRRSGYGVGRFSCRLRRGIRCGRAEDGV